MRARLLSPNGLGHFHIHHLVRGDHTSEHRFVLRNGTRDAFAGEGRGIEGSPIAEQFAVQWHTIAYADADGVTDFDLGGGGFHRVSIRASRSRYRVVHQEVL